MRGFQPATQNFADGGVVKRIKSALGFGEKEPKQQPQMTQAPSPAPAPAPAQEPGRAIGQYAAGSALKRRMAEIDGYADGGPVRGKGTGTSDEVPDEVAEGTYIMPTDSTQAIGEQQLAAMGQGGQVPVNLSNGEFKMPPDQVHAIGVQALDQMKNATHTPVAARGFVPGAQQQSEPPLFFADGGVVEDENSKRFARVPSSIGHQPGRTTGAVVPSAAQLQPAAQPVATAPAPAIAAPPASPHQTSPGNTFPQASPSAGANIYGGVGVSADQFGSSGRFAQVPSSIGQQPGRTPAPVAQPQLATQAGMTDAQRATAISQIPTAGAVAPQRPMAAPVAQPGMTDAQRATAINQIPAGGLTAPQQRGLPAAQPPTGNGVGMEAADAARSMGSTIAGAFPGTVNAIKNSMDDTRQAYQQSGIGGALGAGARTSMTPVIGLADDVMGGVRQLLDPAAQALKTFVTGDATPIGQQPTATPAAPVTAAAQAAPTGATPAAAGREASSPPPVNPSAPTPTSSAPEPTQIATGVFRNGNSYSDSAAGATAGSQTRGLPSAQNMAAANALTQHSQQESSSRVMAGQPVERGWSGVIGTDPAAGRERKEMIASLTSVMPGARGITSAQRGNLQALMNREANSVTAANNNATSLQQTEMQTGTQRDVAAMREAGDNGRAVLREAGETGRAGERNAIDQGRLGLEQQVRGFDIRKGEREEKLHEKYGAAKTQEEKSAISQQIRDLSGKAEPTNRFTVVSGGQEWDATAGVMRNVPDRVLNNQLGQFVEQPDAAQNGQPPAAPQEAAKRVVGQTYTTPNGQTLRWTASGWLPVG